MKERIRCAMLLLALGLLMSDICPRALFADSSESAITEIEPGTVINHQNWRQYRNFMSLGLAALFLGDRFWHLSADLSIRVGPTMSVIWQAGSSATLARFSKERL